MKGNRKNPLDARKPFPTRLRGLLREQGLTHQALADVLGVSRQAVSNYSDGSSTPSWESIVLIAQTLGVTADYLLGISDYRSVEAQEITSPALAYQKKSLKT